MEKELIEFMARAMVDNPDGVQVSILEGERSTILELKVDYDDMGKIIGKHGRIAKAMRTILLAATSKSERRFALEILS